MSPCDIDPEWDRYRSQVPPQPSTALHSPKTPVDGSR